MTQHIADDFSAIAARLKGIKLDPTAGAFGKIEMGKPDCEACTDIGFVDERIGGIATSGWVECPDCHNPEEHPSP